MPTIKKDTDTEVVLWNESREDDPKASPNISILPRLPSSKPTKHRQINTISLLKQEKFDVEEIAEVEDKLSPDKKI